MENTYTLREWSEDDRPRERLMRLGAAQLSDCELLAIILGSGTVGETAVGLARRMLSSTDNNLAELSKLSPRDLSSRFKGVGPAKAVTVVAALELGRRRRELPPNVRPWLNNSRKIFEWMSPQLADLRVEECWALFLNASNRLIEKRKISQGGVNETTVDLRVVMKEAIGCLATSMVLCHNHPSGNVQPSEADNHLTKRMHEACRAMGILLLDHLIIGDGSYYSYADESVL